jgi:hypothetical protein
MANKVSHRIRTNRRPAAGRHKREVPVAGTEAHRIWRANVVAGVRAAKLRRRKAGLLTLREVAAETCLPVGAVRKVFPVIQAGGRSYIRQSVVNKWKADTGADAA